jgi:hypothetical protein
MNPNCNRNRLIHEIAILVGNYDLRSLKFTRNIDMKSSRITNRSRLAADRDRSIMPFDSETLALPTPI